MSAAGGSPRGSLRLRLIGLVEEHNESPLPRGPVGMHTTPQRQSAVDAELSLEGPALSVAGVGWLSKSLPNVSPVSGFEMMTTVLPEHGYVVESEVIIVNGVELSRDIHSDFQESGTGLWFPKSVVRERYELDDNNQKARKLKSRVEYLAVYDVEFDKPLDDSLFRLRGTPQFEGLPAMNFGG